MSLFSILFVIFSYLQTRGLEATVQNLSKPSQNFCSHLLDFNSKHLQLYKAIACGVPVKDSSYEVLKTVSLWHLVIVSAGHFQVILWFLNKFKNKIPWISPLGLLAFSLISGAQPPVLRAYIDYLIRMGSKQWRFWIPSEYCTLYSSCMILVCFPSWTHSWSFLLSWLCGVLILLLQRQSLFIQALGIWIGVFPIACLFSAPHPLGFLFNIIFAPPLSLVLFPLSLLMIAFPILHLIADPFVDFLLYLLTQLAGPSSASSLYKFNYSQITFIGSWIYVLGLQILIILKMRTKVRKKDK